MVVAPVKRSVDPDVVATRTNWTQTGACSPRFLSWELHAHCLSLKNGLKRFRVLVVVELLSLFPAHDCARLLICGIAGLQKGTSDRKQGFAATAHQALRKAHANSFSMSISPIKQC